MSLYDDPSFPAVFIAPGEELREFDKKLVQVLEQWNQTLKFILDKGISLTDNVDAAVVSFTSNGTADTEDTVAHTLGKVPAHFVVTSLDKGAVVYASGTAFTATNIYLKTDTISTVVKLIVF